MKDNWKLKGQLRGKEGKLIGHLVSATFSHHDGAMKSEKLSIKRLGNGVIVMKKLFKAIRAQDYELVKQIIEAKPELVNCTAKQPPKKDDGQSPLQVALKTGAFDIADYLINQGADLNFMEDPSCCNSWRTPVVFDAITAAVMTSRWNTHTSYGGLQVFSTQEAADRAYEILEKMLQAGADPNRTDSYGNTGIWSFCLKASQILPSYNRTTQEESDDRLLTAELEADLLRILKLLCQYGADLTFVSPKLEMTISDYFVSPSMRKLLDRVQ